MEGNKSNKGVPEGQFIPKEKLKVVGIGSGYFAGFQYRAWNRIPEVDLTAMCREAADRGIHIVCQKPLAPTLEEAKQIVDYVKDKPVRFMVHENWRFQPRYF